MAKYEEEDVKEVEELAKEAKRQAAGVDPLEQYRVKDVNKAFPEEDAASGGSGSGSEVGGSGSKEVIETDKFKMETMPASEIIQSVMAKSKSYLTVKDVDAGVKTVLITDIYRSYKITFYNEDNSTPTTQPVIELEVRDVHTNRDYYLRLKTQTIKRMIELFGPDTNTWIGNKLRLSVQIVGKNTKVIGIDKE